MKRPLFDLSITGFVQKLFKRMFEKIVFDIVKCPWSVYFNEIVTQFTNMIWKLTFIRVIGETNKPLTWQFVYVYRCLVVNLFSFEYVLWVLFTIVIHIILQCYWYKMIQISCSCCTTFISVEFNTRFPRSIAICYGGRKRCFW